MIIEPSPEMSATLAKALRREGIKFEIVSSSEEAIAKAENKELKAVVVELLLAKHNGLEFIYEFRTYADWDNVKLFLYTHLSKDEINLSEKLMREIGIDRHYYKPTTSLKKLIKELKKVEENAE